MNPLPGDVHVSTALTNISVAFHQQQSAFVADRVFQNVPVQKQADRYYTYDRGSFNRDEMAERAPGTESAGGSYDLDNTPTYFARTYAYHKDVPDPLRANADSPVNPDRDATHFVSNKGLIKKERIFAANFFTTGVWTTNLTGVDTGVGTGEFLQWNDASSNPIEDIRSAATDMGELTGFRPNVLTLGRRVFDKLVDHPDLVDRIKYGQTPGQPAIVNMQALAALLGVDEVLVMDAIYNSAKQGATATHYFIGGKHALLSYRPPAPGLMTPAAGYTFSWTGFLGANAWGGRIKKFRMEHLESDRIENQYSFDMKQISADLGVFFASAVA
jgi:hypothetical protein